MDLRRTFVVLDVIRSSLAEGGLRVTSTVPDGSRAVPLLRGELGSVWSDACGFDDLALLYTGFTEYAPLLSLGKGWAGRWTATWRLGRAPVVCAVRDLAEVETGQSRPVRRFTWRTGQHHRPGLEYLVSTDRHHGFESFESFESFEEELLLRVADFAVDLVEALSQPFWLRFFTSDGPVEHTPDFLLLTGAGPWLVDVRPAGRIRPEDAVKFAAAAEAALSAGWRYIVVTGWGRHVLTNVDSLAAGRRELTDPLGLQEELLQVAAAGPLSFGELAGRCRVPVVARAHALHLLWHRRLGLDISVPLGDASLVRLAPDQRRAVGTA